MQVVAFCLPITPFAGKTLTLRELAQLPLVVPELKEMGVQSFIIFDKRKPIHPIAGEFLAMLRKRQDSPLQTNNKTVQKPADLSLR
jgi:hypothetical protein